MLPVPHIYGNVYHVAMILSRLRRCLPADFAYFEGVTTCSLGAYILRKWHIGVRKDSFPSNTPLRESRTTQATSAPFCTNLYTTSSRMKTHILASKNILSLCRTVYLCNLQQIFLYNKNRGQTDKSTNRQRKPFQRTPNCVDFPKRRIA